MLFHQNTVVVGGLHRENVQLNIKVWWFMLLPGDQCKQQTSIITRNV